MEDEGGITGENGRSSGAQESPVRRSGSDPSAGRPTWAEIDLDNLRHNFLLIKSLVPPGTSIMPAVKANAYGHGAVECARTLELAGADWFGVALPEEGIKLRQGGVTRPILCLGSFWPGQEDLLLQYSLTPGIFQKVQLDRLEKAAKAIGKVIDYHLKIDTGMGRLGVPFSELEAFLETTTDRDSLRMDGAWTHLASVDDPNQREFTLAQLTKFKEAISLLAAKGFHPTWKHAANGAAVHSLDAAKGGSFNLVRPGGVVYGLWRDVTDPSGLPLELRPVMSLHTRITHLKKVSAGVQLGYGGSFVTRRSSVIATLPIGYEDGLRRALSNQGHVLVRGTVTPIIGRVSMDLTLVDVTDVEGACVGDEVVIIGRQGTQEITAEDVAEEVGTISYEVTCGISERVPRVYVTGRGVPKS